MWVLSSSSREEEEEEEEGERTSSRGPLLVEVNGDSEGGRALLEAGDHWEGDWNCPLFVVIGIVL